ncbi:MAG: hypothetical protein WCO13_03715 [Bacteroidota bacterium]
MKKLLNIILIAILFTESFVFTACKKQEANNNIFLQYLKETFNESNVINEKMFLLIPCSGCSGCDQSVYSIFTNRLLNNKIITLIICDPIHKGLLSATLKADNIKYDFYSKMAEYDFGSGYPVCIVVKDNKVIDKFTLTPERLDKIRKYLKILDL